MTKPHTSFTSSWTSKFDHQYMVIFGAKDSKSTEFKAMKITEMVPKYHYGNTTLYHFYRHGNSINLRTQKGNDLIVYDREEKFIGASINEVSSILRSAGYELEKI